jgi:hypothetical protein
MDKKKAITYRRAKARRADRNTKQRKTSEKILQIKKVTVNQLSAQSLLLLR